MKHLKFSTNWNNKLECRYFTTVRIVNKFTVGERIIIVFKNKFKFGRVMETRKIKGEDFNDFLCYLDTGYNLEQTKSIILKMYDRKNWSDVNHMFLHLIEADKNWNDFDNGDVNLDLV